MSKHWPSWHYLLVLAVLASCGPNLVVGAEPDENESPKPLSPAIVNMWREAGAKVGWMKIVPPQPEGGYKYWVPWRDKDEPGAVPAFRYHPEKDGVLAMLPDPGVAFGVDTHCSAITDAELKLLAGLKNLQSLNVGGSLVLTDKGLKELAGLKNLQGLYLFYVHVSDAGLSELAGLKALRALDLTHTQVTGVGMKKLAGLKSLQALNLSHTKVTDAGLRDLAGLKSLRWVNLCRTKVTANGIAALQKELPACKIISGD